MTHREDTTRGVLWEEDMSSFDSDTSSDSDSGSLVEELYEASKQGDSRKLRLLLAGCRGRVPQESEKSVALVIAVEMGHVECVKLLLQHGANLGVFRGTTALVVAAGHRHLECMDLLLKSGADVNKMDAHGSTVLIEALKCEKTRRVKQPLATLASSAEKCRSLCVDLMLDVTITGHYSCTQGKALHQAAFSCRNACAAFFPGRKNQTREDVEDCYAKCVDMNKALRDNQSHNTEPAGSESVERARACTQVTEICSRKCTEWLAELGDQWRGGPENFVRFTRESGGDEPNSLFRILDLLVQNGADVNQADGDGTTALILAAEMGDKAALALLLVAGADVNRADKKGETALTKAAEKGCEAVVNQLIKSGAHVNQANNCGVTALMKAVNKESEDTVKVLLKSGAKVNQADHEGATAHLYGVANCMGVYAFNSTYDNRDSSNHACLSLLCRSGVIRPKLSNHCQKFDRNRGFSLGIQCGYCQRGLVRAGVQVNETMETRCSFENVEGSNRYLFSAGAYQVICRLPGSIPASVPGYPFRRNHLSTKIYRALVLEGDLSLHNLCRWAIRRRLLRVNSLNLHVTVPQLGLPTRLKDYLLDVPFREASGLKYRF